MPEEPEPPQPVLIEQDVKVDVVSPRHDRLTHMSDDRKLEIATHYANYEIPVDEIVHAYAIGNGDVTRIADELGIPRRDRRNVGRKLPAGRFVEGKWVLRDEAETVPEPQRKALENMLRLPATPEPAAEPALKPLNMHDTRPYFEASVVGLVRVRAADMMDALEQITSQYPDLKTKQIREL